MAMALWWIMDVSHAFGGAVLGVVGFIFQIEDCIGAVIDHFGRWWVRAS